MATCGGDGLWTPSAAVCKRPCSAPPEVINARVIRSSTFGHPMVHQSSNNATGPVTYSEGESVLYFCHPGHVLLGPLKSVCGNDGTWSQAPKCIRKLLKFWKKVARCFLPN